MADPMTAPVLVVVSDLGDERCGVGSSVAALLATIERPVRVLDSALPLRRFAAELRAAERAGVDRAIVEWPGRSVVERRDLPAKFLLLRAVLHGRPVTLHLHEFRRLRRKLKYPATALAAIAGGRVVVSTESERRALAAAARAVVARRQELVIVPPTNGAAPGLTAAGSAVADDGGGDRERTVGVFGMLRPDKGVDWLHRVLGAIEPRFDRLELAGGGWEQHPFPASIEARYTISRLGHVPGARLPAVLGRWGAAVAPYWEGAHDGRMSLRTTLAHGVPTLTRTPELDADLTLRPHHLVLLGEPSGVVAVPVFDDTARAEGAAEVAAFESEVTRRLAAALGLT